MYKWRKLTETERSEILNERKSRGLPWHRPPHLEFLGPVTFIITAACYEHSSIIGRNSERMAEFERTILAACAEADGRIFAWCILPNHYHLLVRTDNIKQLRKEIGKVHGRTARYWNQEDERQGRQVWFNFFDRDMKSDRHFWASLNYIHNNSVHHGYVAKWREWPFSSAHYFLDSVGHKEALRVWREYPVLDYGKDWDIY